MTMSSRVVRPRPTPSRPAAVAAALVFLLLGLAGCGDRVTPSKNEDPPLLVWYFFNPLTSLPKGWETEWTESPHQLNPAKGLVVSGTGITFAGMRSAYLSATLVGTCRGTGSAAAYQHPSQVLLRKATEDPPTTNDRADDGAGGVISFSEAEMASYFVQGLPCTVWASDHSAPGVIQAGGIRFDARVTDYWLRTVRGSFWAYR